MSSASAQAAEAAWVEPTKNDKPSKEADLKHAWAFLKVGVEHIMTRLHMGMSYSYYILLYTAIYDFCTQNRPHTSAFGAGHRGGASLQGADLYRSLHNYLSDHCRQMREEGEKLSDLELLKFYARQWDRYTTGANYVNKMFNYLNKHWVKREKDEGRKEVYTVYTLALVAWKQNFFKHLNSNAGGVSRLTQALLKQIELQRNGEAVDSGLLKRVIDSYVSLGLDEADAQRSNLEVYKEHFQEHFITATQAYYKAESTDFVANNSVSDYMKKAENRLQEEADRVNLYLNDATRTVLKETCEKTLIAAHSEIMWDEFQVLLDADKNDDLTRMYSLLMRISNGLELLRKRFEEHVKKSGLAAVERILPKPNPEDGKTASLDARAYVEALLEVHSKYSDVVNGPFRAELGFNGALDKACREFMNFNSAAESSTRSPELLAAHTDQLLRKGNKDFDTEALEKALNQVMVIFRFMNDQDVFQKFYSKKLANRLVNEASASDDSESSMITKLKDVAGFEYTSKLAKMFQDIALSKDLTERFTEKQRSLGNATDVDFQVKVLGTNFWPLTPAATDYQPPREIQATYDQFVKYYNEAHSGRKLTWLWQHSKNEVKTTYLPQKYIFMVSSYQLAILAQFNEGDQHSFSDIATATKLSEPLLKAQLNVLVKQKVLLQDGDDYDLNLNFKAKKLKINLNMPVKTEQKAESVEVLAAVEEDRKFIYQAVIVRIMKSRKTMKHVALMNEVISNCTQKFTPSPPEIKKAIEELIVKEYLERHATDLATYNYVA